MCTGCFWSKSFDDTLPNFVLGSDTTAGTPTFSQNLGATARIFFRSLNYTDYPIYMALSIKYWLHNFCLMNYVIIYFWSIITDFYSSNFMQINLLFNIFFHVASNFRENFTIVSFVLVSYALRLWSVDLFSSANATCS